ncbi:MAG TPA: protein-methionine-sulfoxide reductase catalytic subunit MsrP [Thermoanaerobaculia bacterium]|jgi:sulfoxide reductase catalytic subunit YedY
MAHIRIPRSWELPDRLATPEDVYLNRRQVLRALGFGALAASLPVPLACSTPTDPELLARGLAPALGKRYANRFPARKNPRYGIGDRRPTPEKDAGGLNNFYEFTTTKDQVWRLALGYPVDPWKIEVAGLVKKPRTLGLDDLVTRFPLEERLYRFRCVERWSMQVPWTGYPLRSLLDFLEPLPSAKYVRFVCVNDPERLPGQKETPWYPWPYFEGLRLDEARNDLAFVVVGSYGHALPMQHGAPLRLAVPWKYGYKGPKSIVKIELTRDQPRTFWNLLQPTEYGFYSNVNPRKPHPRWSQEIETDIGTGGRRPTLLYNGYAEQVGSMYDGKEV